MSKQKDPNIQLQVQHANMFESVMHLRADMPRIVVYIHEPHSIALAHTHADNTTCTAQCHGAHRLPMRI